MYCVKLKVQNLFTLLGELYLNTSKLLNFMIILLANSPATIDNTVYCLRNANIIKYFQHQFILKWFWNSNFTHRA